MGCGLGKDTNTAETHHPRQVTKSIMIDDNGIIEQLLSDKFSGEGCKQTSAYVAHIEPDALEKARAEFWKARMYENSAVWYIISEACHCDEPQAKALMEAAGFTLPNGTLQVVQTRSGKQFNVPIWCINNPINFSAEYHAEKLRNKARPENVEIIQVKVMDAKTGNKEEYEIENTEDALQLKQIYGMNHD